MFFLHLVFISISSVSALTQALNCSVIFLPDSCFIQDHSHGTMIGTGSKFDNLYYLSLAYSSLCNAISTNNNVSLSVHELWHYRLGHPSLVKLNVLHVFWIFLIFLLPICIVVFAIY